MINKKGVIIFLSALCATTAGIFFFHSPKKSNESQLANFTQRSNYTLSEFAKEIAWGKPMTKFTYTTIKNQSMSDELTFQQIQNDILNPLQNQVLLGHSFNFNSFFKSETGQIFGLNLSPTNLVKEQDGIKTFEWSKTTDSTSLENLKKYVASFLKVDDFSIRIKSYYIDMKDRREKDLTPSKMKITGFVDLRGNPSKGIRRHDSGKIELQVENFQGTWKINRIMFDQMQSLISDRTPGFTEVTATAFSGNGPETHLRREAIRRGGYALSVTDVNNDGFLDLYIGSAKESQMWVYNQISSKYENKMKDTFANEKMVKTGVFNDFDNDGYQDLFVTTFNPVVDKKGQNSDLVVYKNEKGFLKKVGDPTRGFSKLHSFNPMPAAVGDFNNDGLMDVYVGFPGKKDFTFTGLVGHQIVGGTQAVQGLFTNKGNLAFNEALMNAPGSMKDGQRQYLYPHSAMAIDWNKDHKMDIVVIDDQNNLSPFYMNKGDGIFEQVAEKIGIRDTDNAMSIAAGDFNNDGLIDFAMTSVNIDAASRFENAMINSWGLDYELHDTGLSGNGVRLFQQSKNGSFTEVTKAAGLENVGEGSAGVEFIDYNNDGYADLYVSNGLWSGNDRTQDAGYLLVDHKLNTAQDVLKDNVRQTVSEFMSLLIDFRGNLFDPKFQGNKSLSVGGYQRKHLFRNNANGTFTDVGYMEGVDSISDGYVVATADLNKDGKTDLILRNGDPGQKDHNFSAVQIFINNLQAGKSIDVALKNSKGSDAIGTGVTIEYGNSKQYKQLLSNNGAAQSERSLHFGIGNKQSIDKLTIHWASGDQIFNNLKAGRYEYSEKKGIQNHVSSL